jgi:hypothetical protein
VANITSTHCTSYNLWLLSPPKQSKAKQMLDPTSLTNHQLYVHTQPSHLTLACRLQEHAQQQQPSFEPPLGNKHIQGVV